MDQAAQPAQLTVTVGDAGADADELARLAGRLRDEIRHEDVESVDLVKAGPAPIGAKGDAATLATLAVAVLPTALPALIAFLGSWLKRNEGRTLKVTMGTGKNAINVEASSAKDLKAALTLLGVTDRAAR